MLRDMVLAAVGAVIQHVLPGQGVVEDGLVVPFLVEQQGQAVSLQV